ncbi:MAG: M3 family metallopeptidase [Pseudomonadota bacterium]
MTADADPIRDAARGDAPHPLAAPGAGPFGLPRFGAATPREMAAAFDHEISRARAAVQAIAADPAAPDVANTVDALAAARAGLGRVARVFFTLAATASSPELRALERDVRPRLAALEAEDRLNPALLARLEATRAPEQDVDGARALALMIEDRRRAGAALAPAERARMAEIMTRLAELGTRFSQSLLADEDAFALRLVGEEDYAGLPDWLRAAAEAAGRERGWGGDGAITLARALVEPFLAASERRDLREAAERAWVARGAGGGETDTRAAIAEILALRAERARLLGFESYAAYKTAPEMAGAPDAARGLLERVWAPARARALEEQAALQRLADADGVALRSWDWRYYAARARRAEEGGVDEAALKPYLALGAVRAAAFDAAGRLFGLSFHAVETDALHHPDARAWEVREQGVDGVERHVGLFIADDFARPGKRSGAWMSALRPQHRLWAEPDGAGESRPIVLNVANFAKAPEGRPTLLTLDDARTLFHEFGHALHGLLSDVRHPRISGTNVARDFVELPSQLFEQWLTAPGLLERHARHAETGAPAPAELLAPLRAARRPGQGFATVEYLASALVDLALHSRGDAPEDPMRIERETLAALGMPEAIEMRHRAAHFAHLFDGEGYAAGYYSYLWAEVMDADAFAAFEETGDVFDPAAARRLRDEILSVGARPEPAAAYRAFRGRDPDPAALLRRRGFSDAA